MLIDSIDSSINESNRYQYQYRLLQASALRLRISTNIAIPPLPVRRPPIHCSCRSTWPTPHTLYACDKRIPGPHGLDPLQGLAVAVYRKLLGATLSSPARLQRLSLQQSICQRIHNLPLLATVFPRTSRPLPLRDSTLSPKSCTRELQLLDPVTLL